MAEAAADAVAAVRSYADARRAGDVRRLEAALDRAIDNQVLEALTAGLHSNCRLTLNFHPDRCRADGSTVAAGLLSTGEYLPQSITGLSSGARTAVSGGDRTQWEHDLFGGAYGDDTMPMGNGVRRPVYGTLDITNDPFGGAPRFGSCVVVLAAHCFHRATFTVGDTHLRPSDRGTISSPVALLAGVFEGATDGNGLGRDLDRDTLMACIMEGCEPAQSARELDHYLEAQVHGPVSLQHDVDAIVADPSFRGTAVQDYFDRAAALYDVEIRWHAGSELSAADIPADFRGPAVVELAQSIVGEAGVLDAASIGRSAAAITFSPPSVAGDAADSPLQLHKYLWHCLLHFGRSA